MSQIAQLPLSFLWFLLQVAIFPPTLFLLLFVGLVMGAKHNKMSNADKARVKPLLWILPIPVLLMALWGGWFKPTEAAPGLDAPRWAILALWVPFGLSVVMGLVLTVINKGVRTFTGFYAFFNVYLAWIMLMMTSMAMSGGWEIT